MPQTKSNPRDTKGRFTSKSNGQSEHLIQEMIANVTYSRAQLIKSLIDPRTDIDDECGYPKTENLTHEDYRLLYEREPVAARVVEVMPDETWKVQPTIYETEDVEQDTPFEQAWNDLPKSLRGESWYQDEEGSPVWEHLKRADQLSGIGSYGVLLLGIDDGRELSEPVAGVEEENSVPSDKDEEITGNYRLQCNAEPRKLLYLRAFEESLANIVSYETNSTSPRFGQPTAYSLTLSDPQTTTQAGYRQPMATKRVHWTRVIHLADNLGSSEVFGTPRMRPVFNRLFDLRRLYGGSAMMYWRGAFFGLSIEGLPGEQTKFDASSVRDVMEKYMTGLQRYILSPNATIKSLAPQVVDPTPQIDVQLTAICIQLRIPKRVFMGSERGELASSEDKGTWNSHLRGRQVGYATPRVIVPFVDRLIMVGVLPEPEGYSVVWPDLDTLSDEEQATVAAKRTEAMAKYVGGNVEALMSPIDYLTRVLDMTQEEAEAILEATMKELEEKEEEEAQKAEEAAKLAQKQGLLPPGQQVPGQSVQAAQGKEAGKAAVPFKRPVAAQSRTVTSS